MTQQQQKTKYPSAFYAAAGVGDLVYEQLRKLQIKAIEFGNEQAPHWKRRVADLSVKVDAVKVRESVVTGTQFAAEKATKVYDTLVARGEKAFQDEAPTTTAAQGTAVVAAAPAKDEVAVVEPDAPVAKKAVTPRKKTA
jgi:heparin binding hemagglutinin HbhA